MPGPTSNRSEDEELEPAPVISVTQVEVDFFDVQHFNAATVLIMEYLPLRSLDKHDDLDYDERMMMIVACMATQMSHHYSCRRTFFFNFCQRTQLDSSLTTHITVTCSFACSFVCSLHP